MLLESGGYRACKVICGERIAIVTRSRRILRQQSAGRAIGSGRLSLHPIYVIDPSTTGSIRSGLDIFLAVGYRKAAWKDQRWRTQVAATACTSAAGYFPHPRSR